MMCCERWQTRKKKKDEGSALVGWVGDWSIPLLGKQSKAKQSKAKQSKAGYLMRWLGHVKNRMIAALTMHDQHTKHRHATHV